MISYCFSGLEGSLLSVSALVNVGLHVLYFKDFVAAFDAEENNFFQGQRDLQTGLWTVDLHLLSSVAKKPHMATAKQMAGWYDDENLVMQICAYQVIPIDVF